MHPIARAKVRFILRTSCVHGRPKANLTQPPAGVARRDSDSRWDFTYLGMQVTRSELMALLRTSLFTRIVPTMKEIGLWGPRIRRRLLIHHCWR